MYDMDSSLVRESQVIIAQYKESEVNWDTLIWLD